MKVRSRHELCQFCLTKNDLIQITDEITSIINSLSISLVHGTQICINCNSSFVCFDKFRQNSLAAQEILGRSKNEILKTIPYGVQDGSISSAFDTILNWLESVTVFLGCVSDQEVKVEDQRSECMEEMESLPEDLFCETFKEETYEESNSESKGSNIRDSRKKSQKLRRKYAKEEELTIVELADDIKNVQRPYSDDETLEQYFQLSLQGQRRPYECPKCNKHYTKGELKYHLNVHNNIRPFKCVIDGCSSRFSSPRIMRVHARRYHQLKIKAERPLYTRRRVHDQRYREVGDDEPTEDAQERRRIAQDKSKIDVICSVCGKEVRKKHFSAHFHTHAAGSSDLTCPYKDQGCTEIFRMRHLQTSHIQKKHDPSYIPELRRADRICELCGKCFTKATMKYHMNVHLGITPYACDFEGCTESFKDPTLLRQHKRTYHLKIKTYRCRYCPKKIYSQEEYDQHKTENCGVKSVACHICGKFINKMNLKCHLAIHKGERNFICPEEGCGKAFLLKNKLKQHSKSHSTECNHECIFCKSAFKCKQSLTSHLAKKHSNSDRTAIRYS